MALRELHLPILAMEVPRLGILPKKKKEDMVGFENQALGCRAGRV